MRNLKALATIADIGSPEARNTAGTLAIAQMASIGDRNCDRDIA